MALRKGAKRGKDLRKRGRGARWHWRIIWKRVVRGRIFALSKRHGLNTVRTIDAVRTRHRKETMYAASLTAKKEMKKLLRMKNLRKWMYALEVLYNAVKLVRKCLKEMTGNKKTPEREEEKEKTPDGE